MAIDETRYIYAIFTLDDNKQVNGVYVGSADEVKKRVNAHLNSKKDTNENQKRLHEIMRAGAFVVRKLNTVSFSERWQEYDWMRFFRDYTRLEVFNTYIDCYEDDGPKEG